jgi:disulfide bond formation protein DsbB
MFGVSTVSLFYGLLALVANVIVIGVIVLAVAGRGSPVAEGLGSVRAAIGPGALVAAFGVALLATLGSLYFSEIAHFEPCRLCWYQRIAMYPLVVILAVAAWRRDASVGRYVVPVAAVGALIATYHYALEWLPGLDSGVCVAAAPCTLVWFRALGFISLPYLALSAFLLIIVLMWIARATPETVADEVMSSRPPRRQPDVSPR